MTVKVISRISELFEPFKLKCDECGSELEVTEFSDLKVGEFGGGGREEGDDKLYVSCPDCHNSARLAEREQKLYLKRILALRKNR